MQAVSQQGRGFLRRRSNDEACEFLGEMSNAPPENERSAVHCDVVGVFVKEHE